MVGWGELAPPRPLDHFAFGILSRIRLLTSFEMASSSPVAADSSGATPWSALRQARHEIVSSGMRQPVRRRGAPLDVRGPDSIAHAPGSASDAILHLGNLAGIPSRLNPAPARPSMLNAIGTLNLLDAIRWHPSPAAASSSSPPPRCGSIPPPPPGRAPSTAPNNIYGVAKAAADQSRPPLRRASSARRHGRPSPSTLIGLDPAISSLPSALRLPDSAAIANGASPSCASAASIL